MDWNAWRVRFACEPCGSEKEFFIISILGLDAVDMGKDLFKAAHKTLHTCPEPMLYACRRLFEVHAIVERIPSKAEMPD